jgi:hypothetical protein
LLGEQQQLSNGAEKRKAMGANDATLFDYCNCSSQPADQDIIDSLKLNPKACHSVCTHPSQSPSRLPLSLRCAMRMRRPHILTLIFPFCRAAAGCAVQACLRFQHTAAPGRQAWPQVMTPGYERMLIWFKYGSFCTSVFGFRHLCFCSFVQN